MTIPAVEYDAAELALVIAFEALAPALQMGAYWTSDEIAALRSRIKTFYIDVQGATCGYCNRYLATTNHRMWDVEHISSRSQHARFMFTPQNLFVSCPDCNIAKGETEVMVNPKRKTYPDSSDAFKIIHPHFDDFLDHIRLVGPVYIPKTDKGRKTIYTCDLLRFAQSGLNLQNRAADTRFEKDVDQVFDESGAVSFAAVEKIVAQLPIKED